MSTITCSLPLITVGGGRSVELAAMTAARICEMLGRIAGIDGGTQ
jgi:hypothetical protein